MRSKFRNGLHDLLLVTHRNLVQGGGTELEIIFSVQRLSGIYFAPNFELFQKFKRFMPSKFRNGLHDLLLITHRNLVQGGGTELVKMWRTDVERVVLRIS
jgi:hypothetical protein